ncbi:diguanylate cyclase [Granulicella sp. WH15]|uniref:GGDEF domain-containing response regulator n=1 Tax=Granulicella sp. WH15 TaxID=2602070 RepID=UPI0013671D2D|nr:diguanylate cyclase [Granulicella sp. WH15]QHN04507.1 diguanylate cyclase [Granulicella sp. WH15]
MTAADRPTILVVDDERINRCVLADLFQNEYRVLLAKDGPTALRRAVDEKISLILLDASMPEMDGYEVLRRLTADERTRNIGVIFVTGQIEDEDEERGLLLGAVDYITKPIRPLLVRARVRNHLKLVHQREELERLSLQDALTGISNRRSFDHAFEQACRHIERSGVPFGLAMIDVDHFKYYNDRYGHGAGDEALRKVAHVLAAAARRPYDLVARYGGEEFVLLLSSGDNFIGMLEKIRAEVALLGIVHEASEVGHLTVSCGGVVASVESARKPADLLAQADNALYQVKKNGRNAVLVHDTSK